MVSSQKMLDQIIEAYKQHHNGYLGPLSVAIIGDNPSLETLTEAQSYWKTGAKFWIVGSSRIRTRNVTISKELPKWTNIPHVFIFMHGEVNLEETIGPMGMILIQRNQAPTKTPKGLTAETLGSSTWLAYNLVATVAPRPTSHRTLARLRQSQADEDGNDAMLVFTVETGHRPSSLLPQIGLILELVGIPPTEAMLMLTQKAIWDRAFTDVTENLIENNAMLALQGSHLLAGAFFCYLLRRMPDLGPKSANHILKRYLSTNFLADVAAVLQLPMLFATHRYPNRHVRATLVQSFVGALYITGEFKAVMAFVTAVYDQVHNMKSSATPQQILQSIATAMHWPAFKIYTSEGITSVVAAPEALDFFTRRGYQGNVTIAQGTNVGAVVAEAVAFLANYNLTEFASTAMRMQEHLRGLDANQRRRFFSTLLTRGFSTFRIDTYDALDRKGKYLQLIGDDRTLLATHTGTEVRLLMDFADSPQDASSQRK